MLLWRAITESDYAHETFHQFPMGPYIVDVWFPRFALAVEIDGKKHEGRAPSDARRDARLAAEGIETLRFPAADIFADPDGAVEEIRAALIRRKPDELRPLHY